MVLIGEDGNDPPRGLLVEAPQPQGVRIPPVAVALGTPHTGKSSAVEDRHVTVIVTVGVVVVVGGTIAVADDQNLSSESHRPMTLRVLLPVAVPSVAEQALFSNSVIFLFHCCCCREQWRCQLLFLERTPRQPSWLRCRFEVHPSQLASPVMRVLD